MEGKRKQLVNLAGKLLAEKGLDTGGGPHQIMLLAGDGSQRRFYRLWYKNIPGIVAIEPGEDQEEGMAEALAAWQIGLHLYENKIPVPEFLGFDPDSGLILSEDLGDQRLHEYVLQQKDSDMESVHATYRDVVRQLARMQVLGSKNFDPAWCWQTPRYDRQLMLERESGYFLQALCLNYLHLEPDLAAVQKEFKTLADHAAQAPGNFFLHRDFQSRNIMLKEGRVRFIDFQGGRLGPLGYDLASLLIDPYVGLSYDLQERLINVYIDELHKFLSYDPDQFRQEYKNLSLQRNLQILGAFAFLSQQRGKPFFQPYIRPALLSLKYTLCTGRECPYPALLKLTETCLETLGQPAD